MTKITLAALPPIALMLLASPGFAQAPSQSRPAGPVSNPTNLCTETPAAKGLRFVCPVPALPPDKDEDDEGDDATVAESEAVRIVLTLPEGTVLRIAIDRHTPISHVGEPVQGHVVSTIYAFDFPVIPAGSLVTGHVTQIASVSKLRRAESYANGDFSPFHGYQVTFDRLLLPNGRALEIETTVSHGAARVVHLVSKSDKDDQQNESAAGPPADIQPDEPVHNPTKLQRLKQFLLAQSPYRQQYIEHGTRFNVTLNHDLDFGSEVQTPDQLAKVGTLPLANTVLHARLLLEVSSATATRGTPVVAELTQPVYSADQQLLLPSGSRLIGQVVEARAARLLHRNGELRVLFEHIEVPGGGLQDVQGTLEGIEVDRSAHMKLDEEGGARAVDPMTRYLSTGVALLLAGAAAHPELDHGTADDADDPAVRAGSGASGFGLAGTVIGLASKSNAVSIVFSAYGASASIYSNFLSRGREVVLPKDAPLEIGLGTRHPNPGGTEQH
jgi:hypothetical protein